jgi:hypothetical protein
VWEVTVRYGKKEAKDTGESSFSFDTGGVTAHITRSLATISRHALSGTAPDCQGGLIAIIRLRLGTHFSAVMER